MIAIEAAVVRRLSHSASSTPGSPRLAIRSAGLESTKIATTGSVRNANATARQSPSRSANNHFSSRRLAEPRLGERLGALSLRQPLDEPLGELGLLSLANHAGRV